MSKPRLVVFGVLLLIAALPILVTGCGTPSELTRSWKNPGYTGGPIERLAVFAILPDPRVRKLLEDTFVRSLPRDTRGTASNTLYETLEKVMIDEITARLKSESYDGVIVARLLSADERLEFVETGINYSAWVGNYGFYSYFSTVRAQVFSPGSVREGAGFRIDTRLYSLKADTLAWAGISTPMETSSMKEAVRDYSDLVIDELLDLKLLKK